MREKIGKDYNKIGSGRREMAGNFSVIVDPYLWKKFKDDDDYYLSYLKMNFRQYM